MMEIRIHGRGGQGAVVASMILARAAHAEGWHVQVFPEFGVERRGVPVAAFARLDREPIQLRTKVYRPDHILVLDPALLHFIDVTSGLKENGWVIINSPSPPSSFEFGGAYQVATVDATSIAAKHKIGTATSPIVNTTMVGAFARATGLISLESVGLAITETIAGPAAEANIAAAREAFGTVTLSMTLLQEALMRAELFGRGEA
jgi:pyruvate ferredoxin oxidoreductase gamma subunit/2-oxoisovalerate ferredoxin oxidoreductase gamma subunit